jgi:hypothetical protein
MNSRFTAGILASQPNGFSFYASNPDMASLEGRLFKNPEEARHAAEELAAKVQS